MAANTSNDTGSTNANEQTVLSWTIQKLLRQKGGEIRKEVAAARVSDFVDIAHPEAQSLIDTGANRGIYRLERRNGAHVITGATPEGDCPTVVSEAFGHTDGVSFTKIDTVDSDIEDQLHEAGITTFEGLSEADSETVASVIAATKGSDDNPTNFRAPCDNSKITDTHQQALRETGYTSYNDVFTATDETIKEEIAAEYDYDTAKGRASFERLEVISENDADDLADEGFETWFDIARADMDELTDVNGRLTEARVEPLREQAIEEIDHAVDHLKETVDHSMLNAAQDIIDDAPLHIPPGTRLHEKALERHEAAQKRNGSGQATAEIRDLTETEEYAGTPVALDDGFDPDDPEAQYVADLGPNAHDPVKTGLPVLDKPSHPQVPKPATADVDGPTVPVDDDGNVIPPAIPTVDYLELPADQVLGFALADDLRAIRLVGPRGCGKNLLLKFLAYETNRPYHGVDADRDTLPKDLWGPRALGDDGGVINLSGPAKTVVQEGGILAINEFPTMPQGAQIGFHQLFNQGRLTLKAHGEVIDPHPEARIVATMNPPTREYRDTEPMNAATRGRFRSFFLDYPAQVENEVETLDRQMNSGQQVVDRDTLEAIVQFAHETRENQNWPTLSTRNLADEVKEYIEWGATPIAAVKNTLASNAEQRQSPEDTYETLNTHL